MGIIISFKIEMAKFKSVQEPQGLKIALVM